ncbi:4-hydroxyphenylpyruvate dioxygenase [Pigmentiphaga aceris]|uniref:4-hydroxyphenylpyruvate dioxygenase n=1 Tax=Pigmentiphaga aceris TaxID=1940612 RepID=A0A5C0B3E7_9BURK|nr:VOC family protein [Pigmentiphaga aceris]QEI08805.1 4-hydroxyphenylpyruvate dioxygenase [Pigmentiphaga aceris]
MSQPFTPWDNPLGVAGFAFIEYAATDLADLDHVFTQLGFGSAGGAALGQTRRYHQADIDLLVDARPDSFGQRYAQSHGVSICGVGIRVANAQAALAHALAQGAKQVAASLAIDAPAIHGIGDTVIYLVDTAPDTTADTTDTSTSTGLRSIDHLTCQVRRGQLDSYVDFFARVFNFRERAVTAGSSDAAQIVARVLESPCGKLCITLAETNTVGNEIGQDAADEARDVREGDHIRHLALQSDDLYASVETLRARGMGFLDAPQTYYELLDSRLPGHGEDTERLAATRILVDSSLDGGVLLQIFTTTLLGGLFFELVQRKGDNGFGHGNFAALFESIELDRQRDPSSAGY